MRYNGALCKIRPRREDGCKQNETAAKKIFAEGVTGTRRRAASPKAGVRSPELGPIAVLADPSAPVDMRSYNTRWGIFSPAQALTYSECFIGSDIEN